MKLKKIIISIIVIVVLSGMLIYRIYEKNKYTGYCQLHGTYGHRYVKCYGNYSPSAKWRAERKADQCNSSVNPVSGCTSTYD